MIKSLASKAFSTHSRVAIVGGGTAGINVQAHLVKSGLVAPADITMFEPRNDHYYQPAFTMIAGGVLGNADQAYAKERKYVVRPMESVLKKGINWEKKKIQGFNPEGSELTTEDGSKHTYDILVVASGVSLRYDLIEGAKEALEDHNHPAVSMYDLGLAYKSSRYRDSFEGGKAIFTLPTMPIKCGGAP